MFQTDSQIIIFNQMATSPTQPLQQ